ncbi:methyltransferase type 12 [Shewanella sp. Choline-02u-19]|uniref:class I SAM-dependent methyltransferase n=1 Tax=unclassified Shewanella TaxID=196818 RepID=UPI000C33A61F|nr:MULTISPECIES: class I SAM-dependent methyltransferase [unclassified Shewanella]PKG56521.1 methyltransferase type 12 [Shewanella sp. GutDb-MelDb]PKG74116.1 methyltransferase type 12 [Shewanella sp. GutCb]PKH56431.1 methyltransferase type 12 [Shewanella sp. Bg11-22]PKI30014.1 methyltransferase type 12 [Shewanella sp. Choline-02u-19]
MEKKKLKANAAPLISQFTELKDFVAASSHVLDLACGTGRNGNWFAQQGCHVTYLDRDLNRLQLSDNTAEVELLQWDLEADDAHTLPANTYDVIVAFNYLHRPLFSQIMDAIKPGGLIIYETFTTQQATIGRPRNPNFLLKTGELKALFANWRCLHYSEGLLGELTNASYKAQIIAQKPL